DQFKAHYLDKKRTAQFEELRNLVGAVSEEETLAFLLPLLVDGERPADENNRLGYFEFAPVKNSPRDVRWLEQAAGRAVKVVAPLLHYLPPAKPMRIVVMHRPLEQILASQQAMLQRLGATVSEDQAAAAGQFARLMQKLPRMLAGKPQWSVLHVSYEAVLADPREQCKRLSAFLGGQWNPALAAKAVDPSQARFG
ncbi:MAG: sulfotransferase, partial [Verrucomicrobiota bacterium]